MEPEQLEDMIYNDIERDDIFVTNIGVTKEQAQMLIVAFEAISEKDPTFRYTLVKNKPRFVKKHGHTHIIRVNSDTKDQSHKRGVWIVKNCGVDGLYYWVR